ncbi:sensor histidine kinase [Dokdonella sp.]|uniref:sensor histidine kinase n=1 Tax=Dokdonella sp. TaxID=2291710 RepID=UPI003527790D
MSSTEWQSAKAEMSDWSLQGQLAWQLTLAIGMLFGGLFFVLDVLVDRNLYDRLDQFLAARAEAFSAQIVEHDPEELRKLLPAYDLAGHAEFFALFDSDNQLRLASVNSGSGALSLPAASTSSQFYDTPLPDGHDGRAIVLRLQQGREPMGDWRLVLATERESWDRTERTVHGVLLGGILLAIGFTVLICLWLLRKAFDGMRMEGERLSRLRSDDDVLAQTGHLPRELIPYATAVRNSLQRLMHSAERERRFSRNIAHEMRTPIAEIRTSAEHALAVGDAPALRSGLEAALAANARMERGIQALLALARYESGQLAPAPDPLDLAALLRQQVSSLGQAEGFDGAQRFALELPAPVWIHSDVGMLERILTNLLHNAHEYGDAEERVRISIDTTAGSYTLCVRNRAHELNAGDVVHFGERYWRGHGEDADASHAGLGLALAMAMADALGLTLEFALEGDAVVARLGPFAAL